MVAAFVPATGSISNKVTIGPGLTAFTSGNVYKAGAQFMINKRIEDVTGKNSLTFVKDKIEENNDNKDLNKKLMLLVEKRIKLTRQKLNLKNINQ